MVAQAVCLAKGSNQHHNHCHRHCHFLIVIIERVIIIIGIFILSIGCIRGVIHGKLL